MTAAVEEALGVDSDHIGQVATAAAFGGLIGARGNSGVILSQVLQGFALSLQNNEKASAPDITKALEEGARMAYRAVISPVEGTILTVVKKSAEGAAARRSEDLLRVMIGIIKSAAAALHNTPELLPVLKQAGVVDAGGKGYVTILEGFLNALKIASPNVKKHISEQAKMSYSKYTKNYQQFHNGVPAIEYLYCTEFLLSGSNLPHNNIKEELSPYGDCLMVVGNEALTRIHLHTNHPGLALEICLKYGTMHDIKINNMVEQNKQLAATSQNLTLKPLGVIAVGAGDGITRIMKNLGADCTIAGGQTLNPSTGELLKAINEVSAQNIIILPNNKNIILAAEQACRLTDKITAVIPSKSIPQGIAALLTINPIDDFETTVQKMRDALGSVRTGEITKAIRDHTGNDIFINQGEVIGLLEGDLKYSGEDTAKVLEDLLKGMIEGDGHIITLYGGAAVKMEQVEELAGKMQAIFSNQDFEVHDGGQPVYDLIISVE